MALLVRACFTSSDRQEDSHTDVFLYPSAEDGQLLFQYGGELRPELADGTARAPLPDHEDADGSRSGTGLRARASRWRTPPVGLLSTVDAADALRAAAVVARGSAGYVTRADLDQVAPATRRDSVPSLRHQTHTPPITMNQQPHRTAADHPPCESLVATLDADEHTRQLGSPPMMSPDHQDDVASPSQIPNSPPNSLDALPESPCRSVVADAGRSIASGLLKFRSRLQSQQLQRAPQPTATEQEPPRARSGKQSRHLLLPQSAVKRAEKTCQTDSRIVCAICLSKISRRALRRRLPCTHTYHSDCILQWLESSVRCPVCMQDVVSAASRTEAAPSTSLSPTLSASVVAIPSSSSAGTISVAESQPVPPAVA